MAVVSEVSTSTRPALRDDTVVVPTGRSQEEILKSMTDLLTLYGANPDSSMSTEDSVQYIILKEHLTAADIWDWGIPALGNRPRFKIGQILDGDVCRAVGELQTILEKAAALVEGRTSCFQIDPRDSCISVLRGAAVVPQLEGAWKILTKRLKMGEQALLKYAAEVRGEQVPASPASTAPELHNALGLIASPGSRLRQMFSSFPHHQAGLDTGTIEKIAAGAPWNDFVPVNSPIL
ncbi:hypothetical protein DFH06DRAFT_1350249 [Mycena polygramma]|nr:hypothetical protein DFH06DRAFT_1350249 [Mycena polygramma]